MSHSLLLSRLEETKEPELSRHFPRLSRCLYTIWSRATENESDPFVHVGTSPCLFCRVVIWCFTAHLKFIPGLLPDTLTVTMSTMLTILLCTSKHNIYLSPVAMVIHPKVMFYYLLTV